MYLSVGKVTANYWLILPFVVFSSPISVVVEVFAAVFVKMFSIFLLSDKKKTTKLKKRNCRKMVSVIKLLQSAFCGVMALIDCAQTYQLVFNSLGLVAPRETTVYAMVFITTV